MSKYRISDMYIYKTRTLLHQILLTIFLWSLYEQPYIYTLHSLTTTNFLLSYQIRLSLLTSHTQRVKHTPLCVIASSGYYSSFVNLSWMKSGRYQRRTQVQATSPPPPPPPSHCSQGVAQQEALLQTPLSWGVYPKSIPLLLPNAIIFQGASHRRTRPSVANAPI